MNDNKLITSKFDIVVIVYLWLGKEFINRHY